MAFDGFTTACLADELNRRLTGGRIAKVVQTESDELLLTVKCAAERGGGQEKLYLSANPSLPLCYLTEKSRQAPMTAPSFCMLLRKHLQNGRILSVTQPGLERVLRFEVEHMSEMGDMCRHVLVIEIMGKHSNIILVDEDGTVTDAIRRVSSMMSSVREVLPGRAYFIPETRNKRDPLTETREAFLGDYVRQDIPTADLIVRTYRGFSRIAAEELCGRAGVEHERAASSLTPSETEALWRGFSKMLSFVRDGAWAPAVWYRAGRDGAAGEPYEFAGFVLTILGDLQRRDFPAMSALLETYYEEKNASTRIRQKSADLRRLVQTILEREVHKYDLQRKQLQDTEKRDKYRVWGELLNTYGYGIEEGASSCELDNYYSGAKEKIPLDPTMTPQQNAVRYFERYTKLKRTAEALESLTAEVSAEITQLREIRGALDMATDEQDLAQIREELEQAGFAKRRESAARGRDRGRAKAPESRPLHYVSSDGYDIYVGKNNLQNDALTFRFASPDDIWLHANDIPGSHVILRTGGRRMEDIPDRTFEEAASLAAYYSAGRDQDKVEIDYLERRNVKKPSGARPGFVVYYTNYSIRAGTDISGLTRRDRDGAAEQPPARQE